MSRAVRFDEYGGVDVLKVVEVQDPVPGPGQLLVGVKAAGINPGEGKIREGMLHERWPATFPSGQGSDLAGVVEAVGDGVDGFPGRRRGDRLHRQSRQPGRAGRHRRRARRPASRAGVPWEVAGALHVAGATAYAAVRAVNLSDGDTVVVSGAAGGVGSLAVQLARRTGATVIGLASEPNHEWLRGSRRDPGDLRRRRGGPDPRAGARRRRRVPRPVGGGYVELALELGVAPDRIDTIADFEAVAKHGVKAEGNAAGASAETLAGSPR